MKKSIIYATTAIICSIVACFLDEYTGAMCMLAIMAIVNCFIKDQSKIFEYSIIWVGVYVVIGGIIMVFYNMWIISKM